MNYDPKKRIKLIDNNMNRTWGKTKKEMKKILRCTGKGVEVFFDVGSCIGMYSLLFAKRLKNVKVYAFEPNTNTYNIFLENIKINGFEKKIKAFNFGFDNKEGDVRLGVPIGRQDEDNDGLYSIDDGKQKLAKLVDAKVKRLKNFVIDNNIDSIDILKIDAEGSEMNILEDSADILNRVKYIHIEINEDYLSERIANFLNRIGFSYVKNTNTINELWKNNKYR